MPSAGSSESADVRMGNGMAQMPGDTRTLVVSAVRGGSSVMRPRARRGGTNDQELSPSACTGALGATSLALLEGGGRISPDLSWS